MGCNKRVIQPKARATQPLISGVVPPQSDVHLSISFSKFKLQPICVDGEFNNYFKDDTHFQTVASSVFGIILCEITSHTYKELCEGGTSGSNLHFHSIDAEHLQIVRRILEAYGHKKQTIDQMLEGNSIFQFSGIMGHTYATRIVCHKIDNILYLLFLDTNHHIYINEKYIRESLFYESCPIYQQEECKYMPSECYAFEYLDLQKIQESYGFTASPIG